MKKTQILFREADYLTVVAEINRSNLGAPVTLSPKEMLEAVFTK
jgi:hypothetical protein